MGQLGEWKPVDVTVFMLALALTCGMVTTVFSDHDQQHPDQLQLVGRVVMGVVAIVSLYVGSRIHR